MQAAGDAFEALLEYAHRKAKAGGDIFSCVDSGQTQRLASVSPNQLWLAISPLENLGIPMESSTRLGDERVQLLRRRMRFLALFARLAMTPECDWRFNQGARSKWMAPAANWCDILSRLRMNSKQPERVHFFLRFSPPRFLIRLHSYPMPGAMPEMLEQFLSGVLETGVRDWLPAENPVRRLLEANDRSGFTRPQPIELGIELCVWKLSLSCLLEILRVLDRFMAAQHQHRQQAVSDRTCNDRVNFYVSAIYIDSRCDLTSGAIELLGDLAGELDHLNPKHLALGWSSSANLLSISKCITGILTGPPGNPLGRLERLVLDMTEIAAGVVCSALRQSTRLREIELTLPMNLHTAAWLAFGIFHADSSSSVTSVRLNTTTTSSEHCLTTSWMGIFKRVLSSPASSQDLAPAATQRSKRDKAPLNSEIALKEVPLPTGQRVFVTPVASARARAQPHLRSSVVGTVCEREVQVVRSLGTWHAIVLSGIGVGWIRQDDIQSLRMRDSQVDQTRAISHIRSFAFTASKLPADNALGHSEHPNVLVELVSLFGQSLQTLHLPAAGLCDSHLEQIVVRCPALTELDISGNSITNITPLLCAYNASTCLIQSLNVSPAHSINDIVGISDLLELVANKTQRIPLRRLTVPIPTDEHLSNAQNFFEHATTIARTPGSLEYLEFSGRRGSNPIAVIVEVIRQRAVEEASQDKTYKDFTYRSKLAVISVTYQGEDRPTSRLDSELLGLIFSFTQSGRLPVLHLSAWSQE